MKNKIILHLPHSSTKLPRFYKRRKKFVSRERIEKFNFAMTDLYTDQLFSFKKYKYVKAKVSRIVCDVEKFLDDEKETMAKYGLGVIYNKTEMGEKLLKIDDKYRNFVVNKYYIKHHKKLDSVVTKNLKKHKVILIDCHSFSQDIIMDEKLRKELPDICIGVEEKYRSEKLLTFTVDYFNAFGYTVKMNYPYVGSMIPNCLINNDEKNFYSIMIEINRKIYLNNTKKSKNFKNLKKLINFYLNFLKNMEELWKK